VKRVCVYAGSSAGVEPTYRQAAAVLGRVLAERGVSVVYGGASIGLMGELADAVLAAGGRVTGVIPQRLVDREVAHEGVTELRVVGSMHERQALMSELSDAALALPGGVGTFVEVFELVTWTQLGIHRKPCGLLNVDGYFDPLAALLDHAVAQGFVRSEHRDIVILERNPETLLERLAAWLAGYRRASTSAAMSRLHEGE
jgi:uncharacterized protein (TIGR00730 family)